MVFGTPITGTPLARTVGERHAAVAADGHQRVEPQRAEVRTTWSERSSKVTSPPGPFTG